MTMDFTGKFMAGEVRKSNEKRETLNKLSRITDLRKALELMLDLQGSPFKEVRDVIKYDEETGKPLEYDWKPEKLFGTDFTFGGENFGDEGINVQLTNEVIEEIKKGPVCFDKDNKRYVAKFEERKFGGGNNYSRAGGSGAEYLVYLSGVRVL